MTLRRSAVNNISESLFILGLASESDCKWKIENRADEKYYVVYFKDHPSGLLPQEIIWN
ncbi:hypothetical protein T01_13443 [Trichinella spiralis]|uniref:Uncharacterized protein n=1 Tax=Trichinella spiralis TaxID=6334 RepID=A0A0V1AH11_TRISP|nr:hypothetical protein T01_13443 [Trichinella spiralis]